MKEYNIKVLSAQATMHLVKINAKETNANGTEWAMNSDTSPRVKQRRFIEKDIIEGFYR